MTHITMTDARNREYDCCVIGAGAAGLALALALCKAGQRVLVVERGGFSTGDISGADDHYDIVSPQTHAARRKTNGEAVGGTLHRWGGRCMPFDPEDFGPRSRPDRPDWPIPYEEYAQWITPAAQFLQTDPRFEEPAPPGWTDVAGVRVDRVERLNAARQAHTLQARLRDGKTPFDLMEQTDLVGTIWSGAQGARRVETLELEKAGVRFSLPCRRLVLACGGLETTRQMLLAQATQPDLFGRAGGPLGRYYMGHLTGSIATITFKTPGVAHGFAYTNTSEHTSPYRRRLVLTQGAPSNTAFWLENIAAQDPRQHSGEISFKHLVAARGRVRHPMKHLANILRDPRGVTDALVSVSNRLIRHDKRHPQRLVTRADGPYRLAYHAEHFPMHDSRVTLSDTSDSCGRRKLNVDFRYGEPTISALVESHLMLARRLADAGAAQLNMPATEKMADAIHSQARDGYHQAGLARMSRMPADGVVDINCRAHGTANLFVASAAVFPVSGQANPTLSVVAFALRLAHWLTITPGTTP